MSARRSPTGLRRARTLAASLLLATAAAGCASSGTPLPQRPAPSQLEPGSPLLSRTLGEGDAWLRQHLMHGEHDAALHVLRRSSARPRDRLLQALQEGLVLHHAGRYAESNRTFEWAEQEADRRYTRSVTRGLGSLIINDLVLPYSPSEGELAIIPYYRMLNYLALGSLQDAVVEARKSTAFLARLDGRKQDPCLHFGLVQYLAGQVFAAAGERNDALVSMRQAERSFRSCGGGGRQAMPKGFAADLLEAALVLGVHEVADSVAERYNLTPADLSAGPNEADLFVLIEHGFAAHRAQQDIYVPLYRDEVGDGKDSDQPSALEAAGRISTRIAASLLAGPEAHRLWDEPVWNLTVDADRSRGRSNVTRSEVVHLLRLAWPVMRLEASRSPTARLVVDGTAIDASVLEDVSARLVHDLESRRTAILTRMVARGLVKALASNGAEEQTEKRAGEFLGALLGMFTRTAANALEQADTRSWTLLPDQISVARLRVPAGERHVRVEVADANGIVDRIVDLGNIHLDPGERVFLSQRVWGPQPGDRERLIQIGIDQYGPAKPAGPIVQPLPTRRPPRARPRPRLDDLPLIPDRQPPLPVPVSSPLSSLSPE